ncbi:MAG: hypothetical protein JJU11_17025 [Candidatus Sumerlaeia bacterium]|nr:hypothetical protein [Candidatus Sumerlaeia bacterium]
MKTSSTPHFARLLGALLLGLLAVALPTTVSAQATSATLSIEIVGSPSLQNGTSFDARIWTSRNDSTTTPSGASLRLYFDNTKVNPTAVVAPDGSDFIVEKSAVVELTPTSHYVNIFVGATSNESLLPELCTVEFDVDYDNNLGDITFDLGLDADSNATYPFVNIQVVDIPNPPFVAVQTTSIPEDYDDSATQNLQAITTVSDWMIMMD